MVQVAISAGFKPEDVLSADAFGTRTVSYDSATGILTITDTSPSNTESAAWQTVLRSVKLNTSQGGGKNNTRTLKYTVFENGRWYLHPIDGKYHFYDCDSTTTTYANALASGDNHLYYGGEVSYLATITDSGENTVLKTTRDQYGSTEAYFSGSDLTTEGTFKWTSGPEIGQTLTYFSWQSPQPNNSGDQDYLYMFGTNDSPYASGTWNDYDATSSFMSLVEWTDAGSATIVIKNQNANAIMFGAGF